MEKSITFSTAIKKKCDGGKTITHKLRFRFMAASLSELVDNMSGNFNSIECKPCTENNRRIYNIYEFCKGDLNKFILLLRKDVYPYEDMDN